MFIGLLAATALSAWTGPTAAPPTNNVAAPINVGTTDQVKDAGLSLNSLLVSGNSLVSGISYVQQKVGIGLVGAPNVTPVVALDVNGTIKLANGGEVCQAVTEGSVRYSATLHKLEYCNGTTWGTVDTDTVNPTGLTACRIGTYSAANGLYYWSAYSSGNTVVQHDIYGTTDGYPYTVTLQCY